MTSSHPMRFGQYELDSAPLGEGGMGVVYRARHVVLGTPAVVKLLRPEMVQHPEMAERFVREAMSAAALKHPHIIEVKDCGQAPNGQWYIALEFLDGVPLSKWLEEPVGFSAHRDGVHRRTEVGPVPPAQALAILSQIASALHAAHEHRPSIVHRDVKPDNIFLVERAGNELFAVLLDFGIAKLSDDRPITRTGVGMGTPAFMAPEQLLNSKDVDRRADVYALGVVLYQLLTGGALPWGNTEAVEIYRLQMLGHLPDPRTIVPSISPSLVEVIHRAMSANREDRWPDARVFAQVLAEAIPAHGMTPSGPEILRTYAQELMPVGSGSTTIGNRISGSVPAAVANAPAVTWGGPSASGMATPYERPTGSSSGVPRVGPTTLGGSAAQSVPNTFGKPPSSRRGLLIALGAVGAAIAATLAAVLMSGGGGASPSANTSATVDASSNATSQPVDAATIVASPGPTIDAGVQLDATIDAAEVIPDAGAKRGDGRGGKPRGANADAGVPASGSGSGKAKPFDPNSVGGDG